LRGPDLNLRGRVAEIATAAAPLTTPETASHLVILSHTAATSTSAPEIAYPSRLPTKARREVSSLDRMHLLSDAAL
jgi:hypothetical protein